MQREGMRRYDIVLVGFEQGEEPEDPALALAETFGIDRETAESITWRVPVTVKRGVDYDTAEKYFHALRSIGAAVRLDEHAPEAPRSGPPSLAPPPAAGSGSHDARPASLAPPPPMSPAPPRPSTSTRGPTAAAPPLRSGPSRPYALELLAAFAYPIQRTAPAVFVGVALVSQLLSYVPLVGGLMSGAVVLGYLFAVLRASANGDDELPMGGDFTDWDDFAGPIVRYVGAIVVCFVPAVVLAFVAPWDEAWALPAVVAAALAGLAYMPAAIIIAAHGSGCLSVLNPVGGVQLIGRLPLAYTLTTLAVGLTVALDVGVVTLLRTVAAVIPVPFLPGFAVRVVGLYFPIVAFRMLGGLISHHEDELGL